METKVSLNTTCKILLNFNRGFSAHGQNWSFFNYHFLLTHEILQKMKVKAKILHLKFAPFSFLKRFHFYSYYTSIIIIIITKWLCFEIYIFFANLMREAARCIMLWLTVPSHLLSMNIITKQFWSTDPFLAYCIIEWITKGLHIPIKLCNTFCSLKQKEGKNLNIWKYFIFVA